MSLTIEGTYTTGITLTDTANNPVSITGTIAVASYGYAIGASGGNGETWTIDNSGLLSAAYAKVINLGSLSGPVAYGVVTNETGGTIAGSVYGIAINGPGAVTNMAGATISAVASQAVFIYGTGSVANQGLISAGNVGIYLAAGGSVTNSAGATIYGAGGVWLQQPGTVTNAGTITGTSAGFGAVSFEAYTSANRLIADPGAVFNGHVTGGGGVLELAQGSGPGTLAGLGTSITNFNTLQFDPGAGWTVAGTATGLTGTIEGFSPLVTIDLTGFAAASDTFAYNVLQLADGSGNYAELSIEGGFTSANFRLSTDGNGGSLITEQLVPGTYVWLAGSGDWATPGNWDQGSVPGATATAAIGGSGNTTVTVGPSESVAVANVDLGAGTLAVGGTVSAIGTLSINGGVVDLSQTGLIDGGTIADPNGSGVQFAGGTFDAVTYQGPLEIGSGARLIVADGLTVTDATGTNPGAIDLTGDAATIEFTGNQTFDGATINLDGGGSPGAQAVISIDGTDGSTLTFGPNAIIDSDAASAQAAVASTGPAQTALINLGTIVAGASGGSFVISPAGGFANAGSIDVADGDTLSIQSGTFDNSGFVSVEGPSTLQLAGTGTVPQLDNTGTITLGSGATFDLAGYVTVPSLGDLINQGATTQIDGTLDGQGGTLAFGAGSMFGSVVLNGEISNAVIAPNDALSIGQGNAALLNDAYAGSLELSGTAESLAIHEGVTLTGADGASPGLVSIVGPHDTLAFANLLTAGSAGQSLNDVTIDIGNAQGADFIAPDFNGGTFTIGPQATIASTTIGALATLTAGTGTEVVLDGTLIAAAPDGTFVVAGSVSAAFVNDGQILVSNGDAFNVGAPLLGAGTIDIASHGIASFAASVAAGETAVFADATGVLRLAQLGSFAAAIDRFVIGDTIDLAGVTATAATWTAGELTIQNNSATLGTLSLDGSYAAADFTVSSDGASGSEITIGAPPPPPAAPPQISGVPGAETLLLQSTETLFSAVSITDAGISNVDTATVTLSAPSAGALANLAGGDYDAISGVYTVAGTASALTSAIDGLVFVPAGSANGLVSTVAFSLSAEGPGGSSGVSTTGVTQVQQFLWLDGTPTDDTALSSSPDGQSFASPLTDKTNEAVVTAPSPGGTYTLPSGYQAEFLGGTADATLTDDSIGNAILVGNSGNDSIIAGAGNDSVIGGDGNNMIVVGTGDVAISVGSGNNMISALTASTFSIGMGNGNNTVAASGTGSISGGAGSNLLFGSGGATVMSSGAQDTVAALGGATQVQASGDGALVFGDFIGSPGALGVTVGGGQATVSAGNSPALVALTGGSALVFGGFSSQAASLSVTDSGSNDTVSGGNSNTAVTLSGSNGLVFGGFGSSAGTLQVLDAGQGDTISTGNSAATISAGANPALVFGGSGSLDFVGGAGGATVSGGTGAMSVDGGAGSMVVYGGSGPLAFAGGAGEAVVVAGASNGNLLTAGSGPTSMAAGSGIDLFTFINGESGGQDVVWQFVHGPDQVHLAGYAPDVVQTVLAGAMTSGGSTTVTLPDSTIITFAGLTQMTASDFV